MINSIQMGDHNIIVGLESQKASYKNMKSRQ